MRSGTKILLVGASNKTARAVARSLYLKHSCEIYILNDTDLALSKSKYVQRFLVKPQMKRNIKSYKKEIFSAIESYNIELLLPITDAAVDIISHFREEFESRIPVIGLNKKEVYKYAHNKLELMIKAQDFGLHTPDFIVVDNSNLYELDTSRITFPAVLKPISSAQIAQDKYNLYKVLFANNEQELIDYLRELVPSTPVMVQEYVEGFGIGYNIYCIDGEIKSEYIHKRLNEHSGVSSYRCVIPIESFSLREKIHQFIQSIGWNGVAMVEFKVNKDNVPYLMEMNGRFFGSSGLGVRAGYDFPSFLYTTQYLKKPEIISNTGKLCSLRYVHDEILLETNKLVQSKKLLPFLKWFFSLFNLLLPDNYLEDNFFTDPRFVIGQFRHSLQKIRKKKQQRLALESVVIKTITATEFHSMKTIVFVCRGNICRSPFAEYYSKQLFPAKTFYSAGTVSLEKRLSPVNAVLASKKLGVDLTMHHSKSLDNFDEKKTDAYIVMDPLNYQELMAEGIPVSKIFFLSNTPIADPYHKGIEQFATAYSQIKNKLDSFNTNNS